MFFSHFFEVDYKLELGEDFNSKLELESDNNDTVSQEDTDQLKRNIQNAIISYQQNQIQRCGEILNEIRGMAMQNFKIVTIYSTEDFIQFLFAAIENCVDFRETIIFLLGSIIFVEKSHLSLLINLGLFSLLSTILTSETNHAILTLAFDIIHLVFVYEPQEIANFRTFFGIDNIVQVVNTVSTNDLESVRFMYTIAKFLDQIIQNEFNIEEMQQYGQIISVFFDLRLYGYGAYLIYAIGNQVSYDLIFKTYEEIIIKDVFGSIAFINDMLVKRNQEIEITHMDKLAISNCLSLISLAVEYIPAANYLDEFDIQRYINLALLRDIKFSEFILEIIKKFLWRNPVYVSEFYDHIEFREFLFNFDEAPFSARYQILLLLFNILEVLDPDYYEEEGFDYLMDKIISCLEEREDEEDNSLFFKLLTIMHRKGYSTIKLCNLVERLSDLEVTDEYEGVKEELMSTLGQDFDYLLGEP